MSDTLVSGRDCPEPLAPKNAVATRKTATAAGWETRCSIWIGTFDGDTVPTRCVQLLARKDDDTVIAMWSGPADGSSMGFHSAWHKGHQLQYGEIKQVLTGVAPVPTKKQAELAKSEAAQMLEAIQALSRIGWPISVSAKGTANVACKGKVPVGAPGLPFLPCAARVERRGDVLCDKGCTEGLIGEME